MKCARCRKPFTPDARKHKCCATCRDKARRRAQRLHAERKAEGVCVRCEDPLTPERRAVSAECFDCMKANCIAYAAQRTKYHREWAARKRAKRAA